VKYRMYFGIPVFNICLVPLILVYWIGSSNEVFSPLVKDAFGYAILFSVAASQLVWAYIMQTANCPHCAKKALPTIADRLKQPTSHGPVPLLLKPVAFLIDKEFFSGYFHCVACEERVDFSRREIKEVNQEV